jgi:hypothetical protein
MMKENYGSYLFWIGIFVAFCFYVWWTKRYARRKAAEKGKLAEFDTLTKKSTGIGYIVWGVISILIPVFSWQSIPAGNEPFVMWGVLIGLAFVLFGWYKFWRSRQ